MEGISRNSSNSGIYNYEINKRKNDSLGDSKELNYNQVLRNTIEEMEENVKNGTIPKPVVQIGVKAYTDKEWDRLIEKVDDAIDNAKEIAKEKAEKMDKEEQKSKNRKEDR